MGICAVKLFVDGKWKIVYVDDLLPCKQSSRAQSFTPVYSKGKNELWVMIIEKAWAKVFGSYEKIEYGTRDEGMQALTGAYCDMVMHFID